MSVDHDHAGVGLNQRHVRQVEAPHLVDPVGQLEQAVLGHQLPLPPQAGIGRVRGITGDEVVLGAVPDHVPVGRGDDRIIQRPDEPPLHVAEIGLVGEIKVRI
jgi:hypothetical protein